MIRRIELLRISVRLLFCALVATVTIAHSAEESVASVTDVRILIDVSGSMKQNDPQNLRAPALRLLSGLLPLGARAGIWIFSEKASNLVAVNNVSEEWKALARKSADKIHSQGLYTDIESALKAASEDWVGANKNSQRAVILLTDGLVDISKDPLLSSTSRTRILDELLVALRKKGVTIYTIALSDNADQELLKLLAQGSGGWYEKAESADKLERLFLHMFERVAKPETLPLIKNQVKVDDAIDEVTFLVFSNRDADPVRLIAPDDTVIEAAKVPASVRWHHESNYDLITVKDPKAGSWKLDAAADPDNRALIVTNLKLAVTELPSAITLSDKLTFEAQLKQDSKTLDKAELLRFVRMRLSHTAQKESLKTNIAVFDDGFGADHAKRDGIFTGQIKDLLQPDTYEFVLSVDGTTFQRERRQTVNVFAAVAQASINPSADNPAGFELVVRPHAALINIDTLVVDVTLSGPKNVKRNIVMTKKNGSEWRSHIDGMVQPGTYKIDVNLVGTRSTNGEPVSDWLAPLTFEMKPPAAAHPPPGPAIKAAVVATPTAQPINWLHTSLKVIALNAIIITCGFFGYRRWRHRTTNPAEELAHD